MKNATGQCQRVAIDWQTSEAPLSEQTDSVVVQALKLILWGKTLVNLKKMKITKQKGWQQS